MASEGAGPPSGPNPFIPIPNRDYNGSRTTLSPALVGAGTAGPMPAGRHGADAR